MKSGSECSFCYFCRRKHYKTMSQSELIEQRGNKSQHADLEADMARKRRAYARGETKFKRCDVGETTDIVNRVQGRFNEEFVEGHFYTLAQYCKLLDAELDVASMSQEEQFDFVVGHGVEVVRDMNGSLGVNEVQLPQGASYKYRRGVHEKCEFAKVTKFEDNQDAKDAFSEMQDTFDVDDSDSCDEQAAEASMNEASAKPVASGNRILAHSPRRPTAAPTATAITRRAAPALTRSASFAS